MGPPPRISERSPRPASWLQQHHAQATALLGAAAGTATAWTAAVTAAQAQRGLGLPMATLFTAVRRPLGAAGGAYLASGGASPPHLPPCAPPAASLPPRQAIGLALVGGALGYVAGGLPPGAGAAPPRWAHGLTTAGIGYALGHGIGREVGVATATALFGPPGCDACSPLGLQRRQRAWLVMVAACEQACATRGAVACVALRPR